MRKTSIVQTRPYPPLADRFILGVTPSIKARYFSSCPSDSISRWTPCPPQSAARGGSRSALAVSGFRLRACLGFSMPSTSSGQRGITPAFVYGVPHPSAGGTSTLMTSALPSAHYRRPDFHFLDHPFDNKNNVGQKKARRNESLRPLCISS